MGTGAANAGAAPRRGRPRDEAADVRLQLAALEVYGERGWHGLTIGEVCRRAGVSKASFYARWPNVADLLADALAAAVGRASEAAADGDLRDMMLAEGRRMVALFTGPARLAFRRMTADRGGAIDALVRIDEQVYRATVQQLHDRMVAALHDELASGAMTVSDVDRVLALFEGAIYMHVLTIRSDDATESAEVLDAYVRQVVDDVLSLIPRGRTSA